jgi:hypothetical protein
MVLEWFTEKIKIFLHLTLRILGTSAGAADGFPVTSLELDAAVCLATKP